MTIAGVTPVLFRVTVCVATLAVRVTVTSVFSVTLFRYHLPSGSMSDGTAGVTGNMGTAPTRGQLAWGDTITLTWTGAEFENYTVSNVANSSFTAGELEYKADGTYTISGVVKGAVSLKIDAGVVPAVTVNTALDTGALGASEEFHHHLQ